MAKLTYSGLQAAFSFDGIQIGQGQTIDVTTDQLTTLQQGKAFNALFELGDVSVLEEERNSKDEMMDLKGIRSELKGLGIAYSNNETLEQLQAKLKQATE